MLLIGNGVIYIVPREPLPGSVKRLMDHFLIYDSTNFISQMRNRFFNESKEKLLFFIANDSAGRRKK